MAGYYGKSSRTATGYPTNDNSPAKQRRIEEEPGVLPSGFHYDVAGNTMPAAGMNTRQSIQGGTVRTDLARSLNQQDMETYNDKAEPSDKYTPRYSQVIS